ncbi:MAG: ABC transporter substrate-binding protein, partial [Chloroflexi bacterium]|nr:ABC transporter substrate-binding protein [Chloroflexota bacterium]
MSKKILWPAVSALMTLSLAIVACAPAATPTAPPTPPAPVTPVTPAAPTIPPAPTQEKPQQEAVKPGPEVPKYGGAITVAITSDPTNFDPGTKRSGGGLTGTVYEKFLNTDWTRGPAGSGVTKLVSDGSSLEDFWAPRLAESWKMPQQGVWILQVRQGMRWQPVNSEAGRLMNSRQVTADDFVSSFNRLMKAPETWIRFGVPLVWQTATIEKTGPWEVTIRTPEDYMTAFVWLIGAGGGFEYLYPPEVAAKYGDMGNWRNAVGTGPFMLVDYVPGSQFVFVKNPVYWEKDPVGPGKGNQLPYLDSFRELIIPDLSTRQAALRTGKLDLLDGVVKVDKESLMKTTPKLENMKYLVASPWVIAMKQAVAGKPFNDVRVRQALMLATDFDALKNDYFGGEAEVLVWPVNSEIGALYQPLSEMPESVQALYRYNPDKAKQLLKEAGYPNGFKTSVVINGVAERIDELSIYAGMWAKVGIELKIDVKEAGAYSAMGGVARSYEDMLYKSLSGGFVGQMYFRYFRGGSLSNPSAIND